MAIAEKTENKTKILVNVYEPLMAIMKHKFDATYLKRDAYLEQALRCEIGFLRKEVITPNSEKAKSYIAESLKQLKLKPLNLLLSTETVDLMNEVCKEKNIPRDAFINRFFLLLVASDRVIRELFFGLCKKRNPDADFEFWELDWDEWGKGNLNRYEVMSRCFNRPNILDSFEELGEISPFWRLRDYFSCNEKEEWKLYGYPFEKDALSNLPTEYGPLRAKSTVGFNTSMSDDEVYKQQTHERVINDKAETDKLLEIMQQEKQARKEKIKLAGDI